jgi:hydrogenase expression/formation protein HypE
MNNILLAHGSGGKLSHDLISNLFVKHFANDVLLRQDDASVVQFPASQLAFTTDSFVVDPVFFPGGNIGKLAVCGTVNDLAVSGAKPLFMSAAFIIEEGFPMADLEQIVLSMAAEAKVAGVKIITGDTKVVDRGKCDKIFINTSGIGALENPLNSNPPEEGDAIIVNGTLGDHGMAIMAARNQLHLGGPLVSDCASLNGLVEHVRNGGIDVRFMRDATRGGVATVLNEYVQQNKTGALLFEEFIPVNEAVRGMCELLGFDPLYVANEGKIVFVVPGAHAEKAVEVMRNHPFGKKAAIIGQITLSHQGKVFLETGIGGKRIVDMLSGDQLPRIC